VVLVRTDVFERDASPHHQSGISGLGTTLPVTVNVLGSPILSTLIMNLIHSSETSLLTRDESVTSEKTAYFVVTAVKT
jgi:hypothetical protein